MSKVAILAAIASLKIQIAVHTADALNQLDTFASDLSSLPECPPVCPEGLNVFAAIGGLDAPLFVKFRLDFIPSGCIPIVEKIGAAGNPDGPGAWTPITEGVENTLDGDKVFATIRHQAGVERVLVYGVRFLRLSDSQLGPRALVEFAFTVPESVPA